MSADEAQQQEQQQALPTSYQHQDPAPPPLEDAIPPLAQSLLLPDIDEDDDASLPEQDDPIESLTRRLRCLFATITFPVLPLGFLTLATLLGMLFAAFVLDADKRCSHPLHLYAGVSLLLLVYARWHTHWRSRRNRWDQMVHTALLLYVYGGITLVQTCHQDEDSCAATCPNLYSALSVYVLALEVFTLSILLPLLCLPCLYLWFLQQTSRDAETMALLQERLRDEDDAPTVEDLVQGLEPVRLVMDPRVIDRTLLLVPTTPEDPDLSQAIKADDLQECCICMEAFDASSSSSTDMVRTKTCGHVYHHKCILRWIRGDWQGDTSRRARRTTCPMCRSDLRPEEQV